MKKVFVVDSNYTNEGHLGMASSWIKWKASTNKDVMVVDDSRLADFVLMTVSSQQGVSRVRSEVRKLIKSGCNAKIILGGGGCYAPAVFDKYCDLICVGEGDKFLDTLFNDGYDAAASLPNAWVRGSKKIVVPDTFFPFETIPPILNPDGTYRLFASRGCRFKCAFCQTGWEEPFRYAPPEAVERNEKIASELSAAGKRVVFVTNDGADKDVQLFGQQEFLSVTLRNLKKIMPLHRSDVKGVRIGVEGVSERLRLAVGKRVSNSDLVEVSRKLLENGVGVRWFFITGLPYESDEDWCELRELVLMLKKQIKKGVVMMNFHAFVPMPATPLCVFPLVDEYWERYDDFRTWFFSGLGFSRHVQLVNPAQYKSRLKRAMESMAATERELRRGWFYNDNVNWRVSTLLSDDEKRKMAIRYKRKLALTNRN